MHEVGFESRRVSLGRPELVSVFFPLNICKLFSFSRPMILISFFHDLGGLFLDDFGFFRGISEGG